MKQININRQLLGIEDLLFGFGQVTQNRAGQSVTITKINAGTLPFDETQSLLEWAQTINLAELGAMTTELQAIYDSIDALNNLEDNLVTLNTLAQAINCLNNLCNNLTKLQNIDTNMTKLQNIDTNMTKLQNIDTNITKLQNIDTNMTKLSSIYSNMTSLQNIYTNMSSLLDINSQIIPHLSEILLVDDYAAQVLADKTTVANDKASVASMKLAVETIYDTFDDRFLGVKLTDPLVDNDGNPLVDGAMYFNTSSNTLKVYNLENTLWVNIPQIYLSGLLDVTLTSITTGDILNWDGSKWVNTRTPSFTSIKLTGGTGTAGTMTWNNTDFTYDIILNSDVTLQDGQEVLVPCINSSASLISNGRPVMAVGTNGNSGNILVNLHDGTKANAKRAIGLATQNMSANNGFGFVTMIGKVRGINTTGSLYGETWADGDILYVKATGNLTNVVPADSELKMGVAFVLHAHTNGTLYVRVTGVDENADRDFINNLVNIHSKTAKTIPVDTDEMMIADSASSWSLKKITWASIKTTIKTYLDTYFIPKVATPITNALAKIQADGTIKNSGVIEDANGNVGIGANSPVGNLDVFKTSLAVSYVRTNNQTLKLSADDSSGRVDIANAAGTPIGFTIGTTERMRIDSAGNVGIGVTPYTNNALLNLKGSGLAIKNDKNGYSSNWSYISNDATGNNSSLVFSSGTGVVILDHVGNLLLQSGTGCIGYGTGAGGTVTQLTSKSTAVTLNKPCGQITMNGAALAAGSSVQFTVNNSLVTASDTVLPSLKYSIYYELVLVDVQNGTFTLRLKNTSGGTLSDAVPINFSIIKGGNA